MRQLLLAAALALLVRSSIADACGGGGQEVPALAADDVPAAMAEVAQAPANYRTLLYQLVQTHDASLAPKLVLIGSKVDPEKRAEYYRSAIVLGGERAFIDVAGRFDGSAAVIDAMRSFPRFVMPWAETVLSRTKFPNEIATLVEHAGGHDYRAEVLRFVGITRNQGAKIKFAALALEWGDESPATYDIIYAGATHHDPAVRDAARKLIDARYITPDQAPRFLKLVEDDLDPTQPMTRDQALKLLMLGSKNHTAFDLAFAGLTSTSVVEQYQAMMIAKLNFKRMAPELLPDLDTLLVRGIAVVQPGKSRVRIADKLQEVLDAIRRHPAG